MFAFALPRVWRAAEGDAQSVRLPFSLSEDYWVFERFARNAVAEADVLALGDSVIWGAYADSDETLTHHLSAVDGRAFANLGFNGAHPAALDGILRLHGRSITDKTVLLHCNLLWLSSPRHDLSDDKEAPFNHVALVPQLDRSLSVYRANLSRRVSVLVEQRSELATLVRHVQQAHCGGLDLPSWTIENPYRLRLDAAPTDARVAARAPIAWSERGIRLQDLAWVELAESVQWRFFRNAVARLRTRGNRVVVLIGPFNEHMLTADARRGYRRLRKGVQQWLADRGIPVLAPASLASELYADASHPLAAGYRELAARIRIPR